MNATYGIAPSSPDLWAGETPSQVLTRRGAKPTFMATSRDINQFANSVRNSGTDDFGIERLCV